MDGLIQALEEALTDTFEQRPGYMGKVAKALRALEELKLVNEDAKKSIAGVLYPPIKSVDENAMLPVQCENDADAPVYQAIADQHNRRPKVGSAEEVLDTACVIREIGPTGTPREMLHRIIKWECDVVCDPTVSVPARHLIDEGLRKAIAAAESVAIPDKVTGNGVKGLIMTALRNALHYHRTPQPAKEVKMTKTCECSNSLLYCNEREGCVLGLHGKPPYKKG